MKKRKRLVALLAGIMAAIMVISLFLSLLPTQANASSAEIRAQINALQQQRKDIKEQITEIKEAYKENEDEIADIIARKNIIDQEIALLHAEIININEQISAFNVLIADKQDELDHAQERYETLNTENKDRIRAMEEDGSVTYWEVLFKASSFSDLLDRLNMVEEIAASDQRRLAELSEAAENVEAAQEELALEKMDLEATKSDLDETQAELDAKREEADALIAELLEKAEDLEALQAEMEQAESDLLTEIAQMEKEYNAAKYQEYLDYMATYVPPETTAPAGGTGNSGSTNNSSGTNSNTGWIRPCSYTMLTSPFGQRDTGIAGASTYHQGVDLSAPAGTPIYASRGGMVTRASFGAASGNCVTINHGDGFSSIYMHMTHYVVSAGQAVAQGQVIGYVGSTGTSSGNHLHFGISYNGVYVNPCAYVNLS